MKFKVLSSLLFGLLGFASISSSADVLVGNQSSGCTWSQTGAMGGQGGVQLNYNVSCPGHASFSVSKVLSFYTNPGRCQLSFFSPSTYYAGSVSGAQCETYSIYKVTTSSSSSSTGSTLTACQTSGKAGKLVVTGGASAPSYAFEQYVLSQCSPCGYNVRPMQATSGQYGYYCNAR
jgi:hypothetical protein